MIRRVLMLALLGTVAAGFPAMDVRAGDVWEWFVKYEFVTIGYLKVNVLEKKVENGRPVARVRLSAHSDPALVFVNVRLKYESLIDLKTGRPLTFVNLAWQGDFYRRVDYRFDYVQKKIFYSMRTFIGKKLENKKNGFVPIRPRLFDGLSLIYWVMRVCSVQGRSTVYFLSLYDSGPVKLSMTGKPETLRLEPVKASLKCYPMKGKLLSEGIVGLNGVFTGWFSADPWRIPVRARLKVWLGSVIVELTPKSMALLVSRRQKIKTPQVKAP